MALDLAQQYSEDVLYMVLSVYRTNHSTTGGGVTDLSPCSVGTMLKQRMPKMRLHPPMLLLVISRPVRQNK